MLNRPSLRRKTQFKPIALNLVPMLDFLVTLIAFLLFTMSFLAIVSIESPFPTVSAKSIPEKIKKKPLQLTVSIHKNSLEVWSPFERIRTRRFPNNAEGNPDTTKLHELIHSIKKRFPSENQVVLAPHGGTSYDQIIAVMDAVRLVEKSDPPLYVKDSNGVDRVAQSLFPNVVFGNLLGDD